jgi:hypothetical protein
MFRPCTARGARPLVTLAVMETIQGKLILMERRGRTRDSISDCQIVDSGTIASDETEDGALNLPLKPTSVFVPQSLPRRGRYGGIYQCAGRK